MTTCLSHNFEAEVYKAIQQIEQNPEGYPVRKKPYHEKLIDVFPYLIVYRIDKKDRQ